MPRGERGERQLVTTEELGDRAVNARRRDQDGQTVDSPVALGRDSFGHAHKMTFKNAPDPDGLLDKASLFPKAKK